MIPAETEAVLLVEQDGDDPLEVRSRLHRLVDELWQQKRLAFGARQAFEDDETELFWHLVDKVQPALYRVKGPSRPVPVVEDMAVAPEALPDFLVRMQNVLKRHQVTASFFCHAGHGQLHVQPFLDLANPDDVQRMRRLADELYQEVFAVQGSISGEHACGLSRTAFVRQQAGPLFDVFLEVKRIFDPENIFNPGKIVGDDPDLITRYSAAAAASGCAACRPAAAPPDRRRSRPAEAAPPELRNLVELQLDWEPARVSDAVAACNRCGECRTQAPRLRMCPIFRCGPTEEASPRAKANLIRGVLTGTLDLSLLDQRRVQGDRRPVRPLPLLPAGMSGRRGHSALDAREQGGLRGGQRPAAGRVGHDAARPAGRAGRSDCPGGQLGAWPTARCAG